MEESKTAPPLVLQELEGSRAVVRGELPSIDGPGSQVTSTLTQLASHSSPSMTLAAAEVTNHWGQGGWSKLQKTGSSRTTMRTPSNHKRNPKNKIAKAIRTFCQALHMDNQSLKITHDNQPSSGVLLKSIAEDPLYTGHVLKNMTKLTLKKSRIDQPCLKLDFLDDSEDGLSGILHLMTLEKYLPSLCILELSSGILSDSLQCGSSWRLAREIESVFPNWTVRIV